MSMAYATTKAELMNASCRQPVRQCLIFPQTGLSFCFWRFICFQTTACEQLSWPFIPLGELALYELFYTLFWDGLPFSGPSVSSAQRSSSLSHAVGHQLPTCRGITLIAVRKLFQPLFCVGLSWPRGSRGEVPARDASCVSGTFRAGDCLRGE